MLASGALEMISDEIIPHFFRCDINGSSFAVGI